MNPNIRPLTETDRKNLEEIEESLEASRLRFIAQLREDRKRLVAALEKAQHELELFDAMHAHYMENS